MQGGTWNWRSRYTLLQSTPPTFAAPRYRSLGHLMRTPSSAPGAVMATSGHSECNSINSNVMTTVCRVQSYSESSVRSILKQQSFRFNENSRNDLWNPYRPGMPDSPRQDTFSSTCRTAAQ